MNPQTWDENSGILFDDAAREELFRELDKDYISGLTLSGGDPLFEKNLDDVLDLVTGINKQYNTPQYIVSTKCDSHNILIDNANEPRLSRPRKSIWLYTGYQWEHIFDQGWRYHPKTQEKLPTGRWRQQQIISLCDVLVDGEYIDSQRDLSLKWRGSANQRVIDIQKSLQKGEVILWE